MDLVGESTPWWKIFLTILSFQYLRYLAFCFAAYWIFWVVFRSWTESRGVNPHPFERKNMIREAKDSFWFCVAVAIPVAVIAMPKVRAHTGIYENIHDYPLAWLPISFILLVVGQDAYFYWVHRMMHLPKVYARVHATHHKSLYPSPFSTFAMDPIEAFLNMGFNMAWLIFVPTNLYLFFAYQTVQFIMNLNGHFGADLMPKVFKKWPVLRHLNRAANHADHHRHFRVNYGLYFTFWDKKMKTFREDDRKYGKERTPASVSAKGA